MRTASKKVYMSILVLILCLITTVSTTYAWVGIFLNSEFDEFDINIKASDLQEYGIELSLTGEEGSFSTEINGIDLKKQILLNLGYNESLLSNAGAIEYEFNHLTLDTCTINPNNNGFNEFQKLDGAIASKQFKFDIYISAYKVYETEISSDYILDAFLVGNLLEGTVGERELLNEFIYPSDFVNNTGNITAGTIIKTAKVDSSSVARLGIEKYEVVDKYHPEQYNENNNVTDIKIYQGGTQNPTYNKVLDIYSFGGILPTRFNLALYNYNKFMYTNYQTPDWAINRGDLEFNNSTNQIIDSSNVEEQIGIDKMMKLRFYFWFEGWDSDCFEVVDRKPVSINLNFSVDNY